MNARSCICLNSHYVALLEVGVIQSWDISTFRNMWIEMLNHYWEGLKLQSVLEKRWSNSFVFDSTLFIKGEKIG